MIHTLALLALACMLPSLSQTPTSPSAEPCEAIEKNQPNVEKKPVAKNAEKLPIIAELTLHDGSTLLCSIQAQCATFTTSYGQTIKIGLTTIEHIVSDTPHQPAVIHFRNGDRLTGTFPIETVKTQSALGEINVPLNSIKKITFTKQESCDKRLTYWSTLDSPEAIYYPKVGPTGTFIEGSFIDGKHGKSFSTDGKPEALTVILPEGAFGKSGCIEFWAKLENPPQRFGDGSNPRFFGIHGKSFGFLLEFSANNGLGYGGLCTLFGGNTCGSTAFGDRNASSYASILGEDIAGWHHYAVIWNHAGIASDKPETNGKAIAIFVDGKLNSSIPLSLKTSFLKEIENASTTLVIASHRYAGFIPFPFAIDELKIWNYDKTEFGILNDLASLHQYVD